MTKLFDRGIKAVESLPADRQDMAGSLLLQIAKATPPEYRLSPDQIADLRQAIAEADRGELASDDEVAEAWRQFDR